MPWFDIITRYFSIDRKRNELVKDFMNRIINFSLNDRIMKVFRNCNIPGISGDTFPNRSGNPFPGSSLWREL